MLRDGRCETCYPAHATKRYRQRQARREVGREVWASARWKKVREVRKAMDGYACVRCGETERLSVHHRVRVADQFADTFFDVELLQTLCHRCHPRAEAELRKGGTRT